MPTLVKESDAMSAYYGCYECIHFGYNSGGPQDYDYWCNLEGYEEIIKQADEKPLLQKIIEGNKDNYFFKDGYCYFSNRVDEYNKFPSTQGSDGHNESTDPASYPRPCLLFRYIGYGEQYDGYKQKT
jgi:hypothetical protein